MTRCAWPANDPLMIKYLDTQWGLPLQDYQKLFESIVLDAFQAGLSWRTVLYKRENFRHAFDNFDYKKIAGYNASKYELLLTDAGIIRNRAKMNAAIVNAQKFMDVQNEFGSFNKYIWQFTNYKTIVNKHANHKHIPANSTASDQMSIALKKLGFTFVGSTICYAYMQAAGMVNDHLVSCHRYKTCK